jgi:L-amino acid N-acyltransferase YncA/acyl carrier protein
MSIGGNGNTQVITNEITQLLRERVLSDSTRAVDPNQPVGALGLGLDSLALLQFITALENRFAIEFPNTLWTDQTKITISHLAELVHANGKTTEIGNNGGNGHTARPQERSIRQILREQGYVRGFFPIVHRLPKRLLRTIVSNNDFYIISFDLTKQQLPEYQASIPIEIRTATPEDINSVTAIWKSSEQPEKRHLYQERLRNGFTGFIAFANDRAVGIDWFSRSGDTEKTMGLRITVKPGVCYGLDLNEHPEYNGKGIGMALLSHAVRESHKEGFKTQYAIVHIKNEKMLGAAIHLLGFKKVGELSTKTVFGAPRSAWTINGRSGEGPTLEL